MSGNATHSLTISSYGDASLSRPAIKGSIPIKSGWTKSSSNVSCCYCLYFVYLFIYVYLYLFLNQRKANIYYASVPQMVSNVFVKNVMQITARQPNVCISFLSFPSPSPCLYFPPPPSLPFSPSPLSLPLSPSLPSLDTLFIVFFHQYGQYFRTGSTTGLQITCPDLNEDNGYWVGATIRARTSDYTYPFYPLPFLSLSSLRFFRFESLSLTKHTFGSTNISAYTKNVQGGGVLTLFDSFTGLDQLQNAAGWGYAILFSLSPSPLLLPCSLPYYILVTTWKTNWRSWIRLESSSTTQAHSDCTSGIFPFRSSLFLLLLIFFLFFYFANYL